MTIKATMDGTSYNNVTTLKCKDSNGTVLKTVTLQEVGTITTPTQTLTKSITSNGTITVDVTNYKTIAITTNVQASSGDDTPTTTPTLSSISATYSGGDVAVGTNVSSLTGVTVTATYSDNSTQTITSGYTLSGTIASGSNTVTVTYQDKTCTFTVNGTSSSSEETTTSKNLFNPSEVLENYFAYATDIKSVSGKNCFILRNLKANHKYVGTTSTGRNTQILLGNTFKVTNLEISNPTSATVGTQATLSNNYIFANDGTKYIEVTEDGDYVVNINNNQTTIPYNQWMIYDFTENGKLETFEAY